MVIKTCYSCIHNDRCKHLKDKKLYGILCKEYEDKNFYLKLPCKVGSTVYIAIPEYRCEGKYTVECENHQACTGCDNFYTGYTYKKEENVSLEYILNNYDRFNKTIFTSLNDLKKAFDTGGVKFL